MGGGDLNLKKSWHPHTLKNQERVWKAEQQKAEEDRKVAELQRELKEERERESLRKTAEDSGAVEKKGDAKLDWMYKGPGGHVSREEYLLGRKIDASFEQLEKAEAEEKTEDDSSAAAQQNKAVYTIEHEINPESVTRRDAGNMQVDMHRKLMEDPLLLIRQREEETKREITANPVKMKQLQQLISSIKSKKKTKNKKKRKKKKKKHSRSTSSSFDSDSEDERSRKKKKKRKSKKKAVSSSSSSSSDSSSSSSSSEEEKKRKKKKRKEKAHKKHKEEKEKIQGKNIPEERHRHSEPQRTVRDFERNRENKSDLNSFRGRDKQDEHRNWGRNRSRERSEERYRDQRRFDRYERPDKHKKYDHRRERSRSRSRSNERRRYGEGSRSSDSQGGKHRLSEREMERKRQDMVDAARKRDEDRKENVQRYTEERKREEEMEKDVGKFSRTHLLSAASRSTIEDRVKSRVSSAQRGSSHMETNFMRK